MSDTDTAPSGATPRTDAAAVATQVYSPNGKSHFVSYVPADFARTLEREVAQLTADFRDLHKRMLPKDREIAQLTAANVLKNEMLSLREKDNTALRAALAPLVMEVRGVLKTITTERDGIIGAPLAIDSTALTLEQVQDLDTAYRAALAKEGGR